MMLGLIPARNYKSLDVPPAMDSKVNPLRVSMVKLTTIADNLLMDKACIPLLAKLTKDHFTFFPWRY